MNELQLQFTFRITNGQFQFQSVPNFFNGNVVAQNGPSPGAVTVQPYGTDVNFSQITAQGNIGYATLQNLDLTNYVEFGSWDPANDLFHPMGWIGPGEIYPFRFSPNFGSSFGGGPGTGTGVVSTGSTLRFRCCDAAGEPIAEPVNVVVNAFQA